MTRPQWIPRWLSLPLVIVIAFLVWMLVASDNNFVKTHALKEEINTLKAEIKAKQDSAHYYERKVNELNTDAETLERIAREQYGMRKENEEVYKTND